MNTKSAVVLAVATLLVGSFAGFQLGHYRNAGSSHESAQAAHSSAASVAEEATRGPHGGRLLEDGSFQVEVTIFEQGVPPQFRLYLYENGKPLSPKAAQAAISLQRLGRPAEPIAFYAERDYLRGDKTVVEPHSFDVTVSADHNGKRSRWRYAQVEARVEMGDAQLKEAGVNILTAGPVRIRSVLELPGAIKPNGDRFVPLLQQFNGTVVAAPVGEGTHVKRGDILAVVESPEVGDLRSALAVARDKAELYRRTLEREEKLFAERISPEQDVLSARQAYREAQISANAAARKLEAMRVTAGGGANVARVELRAPIDGVVTGKSVAPGQAVDAGTVLMSVADTSTVWVELPIYPKDMAAVRPGQAVVIKTSDGETEAQGKVEAVSAVAGEQTRTATARVVLPNREGVWRPGTLVNAVLITNEQEVAVAVDKRAIQTVRDWKVVFGRYGQYLEARPLELGRSDGKMVEVIEGLSAGEQYAAGNSFTVKAELGKAGATHDH